MEISSVRNSHAAAQAFATHAVPIHSASLRPVVQAVQAINKSELLGDNRELTFQLDRETSRPIIRIVDKKTGETLQQIPAEHVIRLAQSFEETSNRSAVSG